MRPVRHLEIDHQALEAPSIHGYIIIIIKFHVGPASLHQMSRDELNAREQYKSRIVKHMSCSATDNLPCFSLSIYSQHWGRPKSLCKLFCYYALISSSDPSNCH